MPDGSTLPASMLDPRLSTEVDLSQMSAADLARRFKTLSDLGDKFGENDDRQSEAEANDASWEAYDLICSRPVNSIKDAVAVLIVAAHGLSDAANQPFFREGAYVPWTSLGRVVKFLANKAGVDPDELGASITTSGVDAVPLSFTAGYWLDRFLFAGGNLHVSKDGDVSMILPHSDGEKAAELATLRDEFHRLDPTAICDVVRHDVQNYICHPYRPTEEKILGRSWFVTRTLSGISTLHAVEIPTGERA